MNSTHTVLYNFKICTITVTISFEKSEFNKQNATVKATVKLTSSEKLTYNLVLNNPSVTVDELAILTKKHRVTIIRTLGKLKDKGGIERVGSDKTGYWKVNSDLKNKVQ